MTSRINEVQIIPVKATDGLVAFANIVFDDCLFLGSIGIYTRPHGDYRLSYPTRKGTKKVFNIFHPINKQIAQEIEQAVLSKYEEVNNEIYNLSKIV